MDKTIEKNETKPYEFDQSAGFLLRAAALFIDFLILSIPMILLMTILPKEIKQTISEDGAVNRIAVYSEFSEIVIGILWLLYKSYLESSNKLGTIGKEKVRIVVVDNHGNRISLSTAIIRNYPFWLPLVSPLDSFETFLFLIAFISFISVGMTENKQGLHDMIAKCHVVKKTAVRNLTGKE